MKCEVRKTLLGEKWTKKSKFDSFYSYLFGCILFFYFDIVVLIKIVQGLRG